MLLNLYFILSKIIIESNIFLLHFALLLGEYGRMKYIYNQILGVFDLPIYIHEKVYRYILPFNVLEDE